MASGSGATPETIQVEVEAWLGESWDPGLTVREWWRRLADEGLSNAQLDPPFGRGYDRGQAGAVFAAFRVVGAMGPPAGMGRSLALPTILTHGTAEQIDRFVPPILDGTEGWCQLFSEPGAGSDLAGLQTRAERDGDEWVVSGQKVWTSTGQHADLAILIARTDPEHPKHEGITYFLFPMRQPGVDVRPLREMTGHAVFNEVFLDEARVPDTYRLGDTNVGWAVANTTLGYERQSIGETSGGLSRAAAGSVAGHLERPCHEFLKGTSRRGQTGQGHISPGTINKLIGIARERLAGRTPGDQVDADLSEQVADLLNDGLIAEIPVRGQTREVVGVGFHRLLVVIDTQNAGPPRPLQAKTQAPRAAEQIGAEQMPGRPQITSQFNEIVEGSRRQLMGWEADEGAADQLHPVGSLLRLPLDRHPGDPNGHGPARWTTGSGCAPVLE